MATTVRFNKFNAPDLSKGRFTRREIQIWDANLHHGDVRPFSCPEVKCDHSGVAGRMVPIRECECLVIPEKSNVVQGFCSGQFFFVREGTLVQATTTSLCDGNADCFAGAPCPTQAPSVVSGCTGDCDGVGVSYVITYVTLHGSIEVESAPSPPSEVVASNGSVPGATVSWVGSTTPHCVVAVRLYRPEATFEDGQSEMSTEGAAWVLVAEFSGSGGGTFVDNVPSHNTGGPLLTHTPMVFPAPEGGLVDVCRTEDGIAVAERHRVYISESGKPMFTFDGVLQVEDEIQAIRAIGNTIFVFTNNKPVKIGYRHTEGTMSIERNVVERSLPLKSIDSLSVWGSKIYFASTYSLYEWDIGGYGSDITATLSMMITPEQWKNMQPESVRGTAYEYGYMMACDGIEHALMIEYGKDGTDTNVQYHVMPITYAKADLYSTTEEGIITYLQDGQIWSWDWRRDFCGQVTEWDNIIPNACEQCECCPWRVRLYVDNEGKNRFTKMRVEWDERSYSHIDATFRHEAFGQEDVMLGDARIINSRGFSIPRYRSAQTFSVTLTSCAIMHEVRFATSNQELVTSSNAVVE